MLLHTRHTLSVCNRGDGNAISLYRWSWRRTGLEEGNNEFGFEHLGIGVLFKTFKLCRTDNWIDRSKRRSLAENKFGGLVLSFISKQWKHMRFPKEKYYYEKRQVLMTEFQEIPVLRKDQGKWTGKGDRGTGRNVEENPEDWDITEPKEEFCSRKEWSAILGAAERSTNLTLNDIYWV